MILTSTSAGSSTRTGTRFLAEVEDEPTDDGARLVIEKTEGTAKTESSSRSETDEEDSSNCGGIGGWWEQEEVDGGETQLGEADSSLEASSVGVAASAGWPSWHCVLVRGLILQSTPQAGESDLT